MSFAFARALTAHLLCVSLIFQSLELLKLSKSVAVLKIWSEKNLSAELERSLPIPRAWCRWLARDKSLETLARIELCLAAIAFLLPSVWIFAVLLITHVLICVRFRGSVNGGSDAMTAMVLLGTCLAFAFNKVHFARFGLIWIAIHLFLSYFRSALAKLKRSEWRNGYALRHFLNQSFYADIRSLDFPNGVMRIVSVSVIGAEFAFALSPLLFANWPAGLTLIAFPLAAIFHFSIYWLLGLNRFFWIWMAAWPSFIYLTNTL